MRLESFLCPTQHQFICLSSHGCLSNLTWKNPNPRHGAGPWRLVPWFHLSLWLFTSFSKITYRIFKYYARTTSSPRHTEQSATSSHKTNEGAIKRKKPYQETPSWPGYSWWWTCVPGRFSAGLHSWNWKLLHRHHHFLWTLTHNHTAQPDVSSHMRTVHTSSKMYLKPAPRGAWHIILILSSDKPDHFADPSMLVLSCVFSNTELI